MRIDAGSGRPRRDRAGTDAKRGDTTCQNKQTSTPSPYAPDVTLAPRLPDRRRAALLLAVLFVPFVAGSVFAGFSVCSGPDGVSTAWEASSDCPRRALGEPTTPARVSEDAPSTSACVVITGSDEAMAAVQAAPPQTPTVAAFVVPAVTEVPAPEPVLGKVRQRGPPEEPSHLLRSVVLRV